MGWVINATPRSLYPRERETERERERGTRFVGGWVGHSAGLDG